MLIFTQPADAEKLTDAALALASARLLHPLMAKAFNYKGILASNRAHYLTAIENYQSSLAAYQSSNDMNGAAMVTNNIGVVYSNLEEHRHAINNFEMGAQLAIKANRMDNALHCMFNVCAEFMELERYDTAEVKLAELKTLTSKMPGIVNTDILEGELLLERGQLDSAYQYLHQALAWYLGEKDDFLAASARLQMAKCLMQMERFHDAGYALAIAEKQIQSSQFNELFLELLDIKAKLNEKQGYYHEAYLAKARFTEVNDSLRHIANYHRLSELNMKYETEKRTLQMARLDQENKQKSSMIRVTMIGIFALVLLVGLILYFLAKNRKVNDLLTKQNAEINRQKQKVMASINYAKRIQDSILIPESELNRYFADSFIYFKPRDIVSGDFYWFYREGSRVTIASVDCTGHGVPGAFLSLIASNKLRKVIGELGSYDPARVLKRLDEEIVISLNQDKNFGISHDGMEIGLSVIDTEARTITFAGSGSGAYVVGGEGKCEELKATTMALGGSAAYRDLNHSKKYFQNMVYHYQSGDHLFMYTDGLMDQFGGPENRKLNKSGFRKLIASLSRDGLHRAKENCDRILREWMGGTKQLDDILLIGVKL
ncbi:MAG: SpoIIE family protein phosphatase [Flavobacteriales bacterium]|nr:SpoIIE family protein phosphatase [Flavobacteriales bacterium]